LSVAKTVLGALAAVVTPIVHARFATLTTHIDKCLVDEQFAASRCAPLAHVINPRWMVEQFFVGLAYLIQAVNFLLLVSVDPSAPLAGFHGCVRVQCFVKYFDIFFAYGIAQDDVAL